MNSEIIREICDGNINALKQIPKSRITTQISSLLLSNMENNKLQIQKNIDTDSYSSDFKYNCLYYMGKLHNIDQCISYLKKIT
jgi:hypothetical protein